MAAVRFLHLPFSKVATYRAALAIAVVAGAASLAQLGFPSLPGNDTNIGAVWSSILETVWFIPLTLILVYEGARGAAAEEATPQFLASPDNQSPSDSSLRSRWLVITIAVAPLLALYAFTIVSAVMSYDGYCYGFTDGKSECSLVEKLSINLAFGTVFFGIFCFLWAALVLLLGRRKR